MKSILVKLPNWIGDILFSYDLLYSLLRSFDRMFLLTSTHHSELFNIFPLENSEIIEYSPEEWPRLTKTMLNKISNLQVDCGLLLPNSIGSAITLRKAGIKNLYGYNTENRGSLLSHSLAPPDYKMRQTEYYLRLLKLFEVNPKFYPIQISTQKNGSVVMHPGASKIQRAWHLERFLKLADLLKEKGLEVIFVSGEEVSTSDFPLQMKPSLQEFSGLLRRCSLFIGNDSGPLHLAQQCGASVVGIYGPGDPLITGPRSITPHRVIYHSYPCSPCRQKFFKDCNPASSGKPFCIETISTNEVLHASLELLAAG
jgi:lipopolysaccharide heptosyltransferase II